MQNQEKRIPMLIEVDKDGKPILSEKDGVDLLLCGERTTEEEIDAIAKPQNIEKAQ